MVGVVLVLVKGERSLVDLMPRLALMKYHKLVYHNEYNHRL